MAGVRKTGLHPPIGAERLTEVKLPDNVVAASLKIDVFAYKHLWFSNAVSVKKKLIQVCERCRTR